MLFAAGLVLFIRVIHETGAEKLRDVLPILSHPAAWMVFSIYILMNFWDTAAWVVMDPLARDRSVSRWKDFYLIRLAGEAINTVTPFIDIGGEFLKAALAIDILKMPRKSAVTTVVLTRTTLFFSEIAFWASGFLPALWMISLPASVRWGLGGTVAVFTLLAVVILFLQKRGFFRTIFTALRRFGVNPDFAQRFHVSLQEIDDEITSFYQSKKNALWFSFFLHWIGWAVGGLEMYFMFKMLGSPLNVWQALLGEAFFQIVRTGSFFIPANLGTQEAGLALFAQWMGVHPSQGVLVSLLKRARQLLWAVIGFAIWGIYYIIAPSKSRASLET